MVLLTEWRVRRRVGEGGVWCFCTRVRHTPAPSLEISHEFIDILFLMYDCKSLLGDLAELIRVLSGLHLVVVPLFPVPFLPTLYDTVLYSVFLVQSILTNGLTAFLFRTLARAHRRLWPDREGYRRIGSHRARFLTPPSTYAIDPPTVYSRQITNSKEIVPQRPPSMTVLCLLACPCAPGNSRHQAFQSMGPEWRRHTRSRRDYPGRPYPGRRYSGHGRHPQGWLQVGRRDAQDWGIRRRDACRAQEVSLGSGTGGGMKVPGGKRGGCPDSGLSEECVALDKVDRRVRMTSLCSFSCCLSFTTPDTAAAVELYSKTRVAITVPLPCRRSPRCCLPSYTADASGRWHSRTDAPGRCFIDARHDAAGRVDAGPNARGHDDSQPVPRPCGSRGIRGADDAGACAADALGERVGREESSPDGRGARRDVPSCWVSVENGVIDNSTRDSIRVNCCIACIMCV